MSAFHKYYLATDDLLAMYGIWQHLTDSSNDAIEIFNDGVRDAVWIDTDGDDEGYGIGWLSLTGYNFQSHAGFAVTRLRMNSSEPNINDGYNGGTCIIAGGLFDGESKVIDDHTSSSDYLDFASAWTPQTMSGTHTTNTTTAVVGDGSALYTTELAVGDLITINSEQREIATITDFQNLTVTSAFTSSAAYSATLDHPSSNTGTTYTVEMYPRAGYATPTKKENFTQGSFLVLQPTFANPSEITGTAQAAPGGNNTIKLDATHSEVDDYYNGNEINITSGPANGDSRTISDYDNATNVATVTVDFTSPPLVTNTYEITRRWQCKIIRSNGTSNDYTHAIGSPNGGFTMASASSGATDDFGINATTGQRHWFEGAGATPGAGDRYYISSSDTDTYSGGAEKYAYFRCIYRSPDDTSISHSMYVGGYIPFDTTLNTDPFVFLANRPEIGSNSSSVKTWGSVVINDNCRNRVPLEDGRATTDMTSTGYAYIRAGSRLVKNSFPHTRAGNPIAQPIYLHCNDDDTCLGYFGTGTMVAINGNVPDWSTNSADTYIATRDIGQAWSG